MATSSCLVIAQLARGYVRLNIRTSCYYRNSRRTAAAAVTERWRAGKTDSGALCLPSCRTTAAVTTDRVCRQRTGSGGGGGTSFLSLSRGSGSGAAGLVHRRPGAFECPITRVLSVRVCVYVLLSPRRLFHQLYRLYYSTAKSAGPIVVKRRHGYCSWYCYMHVPYAVERRWPSTKPSHRSRSNVWTTSSALNNRMSHRRRTADDHRAHDDISREKRSSATEALPVVIVTALPWASATSLGCTRRTVRCRCRQSSNTWPRRPRNHRRRHRRLPLLLLRCRLRRSCRNSNRRTRCCCRRRCCRKRPRRPPCTTRYRRYRRRCSHRRRPCRYRWASCSPDTHYTRSSSNNFTIKTTIITITRARKTHCCLLRRPRRRPYRPRSQ